MYAGQTLFAQLIALVPWTTFATAGWGGVAAVPRERVAELRGAPTAATAFAHLTCRGSLRDIGTCVPAQAANTLVTWAFVSEVRALTVGSEANGERGTRQHPQLASARGTRLYQARKLCAGERTSGMGLENTVYALDSTAHRSLLVGVRHGHISDRRTRTVEPCIPCSSLRGRILRALAVARTASCTTCTGRHAQGTRGWCHLRHGSSVYRLGCLQRGRRLFRDPRQDQSQCPIEFIRRPPICTGGCDCRPNHRTGRHPQ